MRRGDLTTGFDRWLANLDAGVIDGLTAVADEAQGLAVATDSYQDDTGATRGSTVGYVTGLGADASAKVSRAAGEVDRLNDGHALVDDEGDAPAGVGLAILTVPTDYAIDLERERAGARAFLAESMQLAAAGAIDHIARAIRRRGGG